MLHTRVNGIRYCSVSTLVVARLQRREVTGGDFCKMSSARGISSRRAYQMWPGEQS